MADAPVAEDWWGGGLAAFQRGDMATAREAFERVLSEQEVASAHELLGWVCLMLEDVEASRRHSQAAYRLHRQGGDVRQAASAALLIAQAHDWLGNGAASRGWLSRAGRLLDQVGPCVERGYLELALAGCQVHDAATLERSARRALEVAREFGDVDLEARALADWGLAVVCQGRVGEGLALLDEAMAAVVSGDVGQRAMAGLACCSMLTACERLGDLDRAMQWLEAVHTTSRHRFGDPPPQVLYTHCRLVYGGLLSEAGRLPEAEAEFRRLLDSTRNVPKLAEARAGIADVCIEQGRLAEAEEILAGWEDRAEVARAMARLHLVRGELDLAAAILDRALGEYETDLLTSGPLLALHVEVQCRLGRLDDAASSADRLAAIAEQLPTPSLTALARLSAGRVAPARGQDPAPHLRAAIRALGEGERPLLCAQIHLELAGELSASDRPAAVMEARCALAIFDRVKAASRAAEAAALLRRLGVSGRAGTRGGPMADCLTQREREVLVLLAQGLTNNQIGSRLFITPKTAEHHVGSVLGKLGFKTRAEAAAFAASHPDEVSGRQAVEV